MYPWFSLHFCNNQVYSFTEHCCRRKDIVHAYEHICKVKPQQEGVHRGKHLCTRTNCYLTPLLCVFVPRFVYLIALSSGLSTFYLCRIDDTASAWDYSTNEFNSCSALRVVLHELHWKVPLQTTHSHSAPFWPFCFLFFNSGVIFLVRSAPPQTRAAPLFVYLI